MIGSPGLSGGLGAALTSFAAGASAASLCAVWLAERVAVAAAFAVFARLFAVPPRGAAVLSADVWRPLAARVAPPSPERLGVALRAVERPGALADLCFLSSTVSVSPRGFASYCAKSFLKPGLTVSLGFIVWRRSRGPACEARWRRLR